MEAAATEYRCFVGGLAWTTDDHSLEDAFRPFGEVIESKVINHRETGRSRGFGFVAFANEQSMIDAIEGMNGKDLDGRSITVSQAENRSGGRGGGGGYQGSGGGGGGYGGTSRQGDRDNGYGGGSRYGDRDNGSGGRPNGGGYGAGRDRSDGAAGYGYGAGGGGNYGGGARYAPGQGPDSSTWRK